MPSSLLDVARAAERIDGSVRPVSVVPGWRVDGARVVLALEHLQHTGSFKARGALNFLQASRESGALGQQGVAIASGGNAGLACAWAAARLRVPATVFVPRGAPAVKVDRIRSLGAAVRTVGHEYAEAFEASQQFASETGAILSHAYDHPDVAAGAGTLVPEILRQVPGLTSIAVSVGGGGLLAGVVSAAAPAGVRVLAVEPTGCRALHAALEAGRPVDTPVRSIASDSLGARRVGDLALDLARSEDVVPVLVDDEEIVRSRRLLWDEHRLVVEHAAAAAVAGVVGASRPASGKDETVCVVLCGANTDPTDL